MVYRQAMNLWAAAGWGLAGGLCVEAVALYAVIRNSSKWSWRRPIPQGAVAYLISVAARAGAGAGLAAAAAGSGQVVGTFAAFGLGVAAPLVVEKLARAIPLTDILQVAQREDSVAEDITAQVRDQTRVVEGGTNDAD